MAFGRHWEWRGFGPLSGPARSRIEALPLKYPASQKVVDRYLWIPACLINVKLRFNDLKFKRLVGEADGLECWVEDEAENYPFPVAPEVVAELAAELGVPARRPAASVPNGVELVALLREAAPGVAVVEVNKERWQHEWSPPEGGDPVLVEVAEILAPERITSVALEHPSARPVAAARDALRPPEMRRRSYLEAVAIWARGERL
jgi:hypothetical protein